MRDRNKCCRVGMFWISFSLAAAAVNLTAQPIAIVGAKIHPVSGPAIENGVVIFDDGRITAVGAAGQMAVPEGATTIEASGKIVTPGFIDAATSLGLVEVGSIPTTRDNSLSGDPIRPAFDVRDGLNSFSSLIPITRVEGVTTVASIPSGGILSGTSAVIDLVPGRSDEMLVRTRAAHYADLSPRAASTVGGGRGAIQMHLREVFDEARTFAARPGDFRAVESPVAFASRTDLASLAPLLDGSVKLVVRASRASDIESALRLGEEYGLDLAILGGEEAWLVAGQLARGKIPVIVKPLTNLPTQFDRLGSRFDNAALLEQAGVRVVVSTMTSHNARNLRFEAGNAVRFGMTWDEALRSVTLSAAEAIGIEESHGSLEVGKTANVVIWSDDPFEFASAAEKVFIRGVAMSADTRQKQLLERYRTLPR